jgi:hypothetical protein
MVESDQLKHHIEVTSFAKVATDCMHACYIEVLWTPNF